MELEIEHKMAIIVASFLLLFIGVAIAYNYSATVNTYGSIIHNIGVETDVTTIDWGTIEIGQSSNRIVQVTSTSDIDITLQFSKSNWQPPEIEPYLTFSENYTATSPTIAPNEQISVEFSLYVSPTITGFTDFSFDITIEGIAV